MHKNTVLTLHNIPSVCVDEVEGEMIHYDNHILTLLESIIILMLNYFVFSNNYSYCIIFSLFWIFTVYFGHFVHLLIYLRDGTLVRTAVFETFLLTPEYIQSVSAAVRSRSALLSLQSCLCGYGWDEFFGDYYPSNMEHGQLIVECEKLAIHLLGNSRNNCPCFITIIFKRLIEIFHINVYNSLPQYIINSIMFHIAVVFITFYLISTKMVYFIYKYTVNYVINSKTFNMSNFLRFHLLSSIILFGWSAVVELHYILPGFTSHYLGKLQYNVLEWITTVHEERFRNDSGMVQHKQVRRITIGLKFQYYVLAQYLCKITDLNDKKMNEMEELALLCVALFNDVYGFDSDETSNEMKDIKNIDNNIEKALKLVQKEHSKYQSLFLNAVHDSLINQHDESFKQYVHFLYYNTQGIYQWMVCSKRYDNRQKKLLKKYGIKIEVVPESNMLPIYQTKYVPFTENISNKETYVFY